MNFGLEKYIFCDLSWGKISILPSKTKLVNPLSANHTIPQSGQTSAFDHFVGLALKG